MDTDNIRQQLMELWKRSFDDTDAFVRLFFTHVYRKENALYIEQGGRIVSALQMLPYTMQFYGKEIPVSYIYGACTHPEERGKGWMSALIQKAFKVMAERHIALTVIIPAEKSLFDYYRRFGYTEAFDYASPFRQRFAKTQTSLSPRPMHPNKRASFTTSTANNGNAHATFSTIRKISPRFCTNRSNPADKC